MANLLNALLNIRKKPVQELIAHYNNYGRNRANNMGYALEEYVKDAFAGTITEASEKARNEQIYKTFCWTGNQNNPPDAILRNGDAIEVKKIESYDSGIALNSSYPKHKLFSNDPRITRDCRQCEDWDEKDIIYIVGVARDNKLHHLWMVYGDCYAASKEVYERIWGEVAGGISSIQGLEFSKTRELGRVNRVDPLGITYLRVRGMWGIENPSKVFRYIYERPSGSGLHLACLMREDKYYSFPKEDRGLIERNASFAIKDAKIKDPDNPAKLLNAKLITL